MVGRLLAGNISGATIETVQMACMRLKGRACSTPCAVYKREQAALHSQSGLEGALSMLVLKELVLGSKTRCHCHFHVLQCLWPCC
jgi:hypothetical protein